MKRVESKMTEEEAEQLLNDANGSVYKAFRMMGCSRFRSALLVVVIEVKYRVRANILAMRNTAEQFGVTYAEARYNVLLGALQAGDLRRAIMVLITFLYHPPVA